MVLCASACSAIPIGPVESPEIYPDKSTAELALKTYLYAWNQGDVDVLQRVTGLWLREELVNLVKRQGEEKTSLWYRQDASNLRVVELEWTIKGERKLAYARAVLATDSKPRIELRFAQMKRSDGWVVTGAKLIR